jgi:hypothetical protein
MVVKKYILGNNILFDLYTKRVKLKNNAEVTSVHPHISSPKLLILILILGFCIENWQKN